ncbi:acyltransferase family protein [Pseudactinotalea sp.]|uniref:acyltransferase family protein n=1 Tax=Pseudactinotalea sp. TaxID=1926260 RepID=UPI003B3B9B57
MSISEKQPSPPTQQREGQGHRGAQGFRPDIEGLRAVAIGLVLLYHGGLDQLTGGFVGVDVFFVISGFLITGLLIREIEKSGRISLARFYARRAKRLLPATAVVLVVTAFLTWLTVSVIDWRTFGTDIVAAALYVVNWQLAARSVDYLAEDVGVSPVQHFWSLAVEEQFYIVWPLLLVVIAWWVRRRAAARLRAVMTLGILVIVLPSLAYSVYLTSTGPATAFFVTPTRLWELGIGAFVAIGSAIWPRLPRIGAAVLGWAGLLAIGLSGLVFSSSTPWPGYHALAPTLGTAAVIVAGFAAGKAGPAVLLSWRPAVWIGGLSYSLYLWHWPLLIAATAYWGELGTKKGLLVMAVAFIPAYLCYRFVENPIRFAPSLSASNRYTLSLGATFTLIGVVAGLVLSLAVPSTATRPDDGAGGSDEALGAAVLEPDAPATSGGDGTAESLAEVEWFTPAALDAPDDVPDAYEQGCQVAQDSPDPVLCEYGDPESDTVVAVVGDSKILQWESAFEEIATERGWRVVSMTKSACVFGPNSNSRQGGVYTECTEWSATVLTQLLELQPDVVLTSQGARTGYAPGAEEPTEQAMVDGIADYWGTLIENDIRVGVVLEVPEPPGNVWECVAENPDDIATCAFPTDEGIDGSAAAVQTEAAERVGAEIIDYTDIICPSTVCPPVIGNVLVWRQGGHITDTYVRTASGLMREQLIDAVEQ